MHRTVVTVAYRYMQYFAVFPDRMHDILESCWGVFLSRSFDVESLH